LFKSESYGSFWTNTHLVMSSSPLVLLTGATGHLGFKTLIDTLQAGYRVRSAVRSHSKAQTILGNPVFKALKIPSEQLSCVVVPDLAVPGAYDEAAAGVDYVIHIASPLTTGKTMTQEEFQKFFIEPAVQGTVGMLKSAQKAGTVKRVVITSSVVAIVPASELVKSADTIVTAEARAPSNPGPYGSEFEAYSASKVAALNEAEKWTQESNPSFDVVYIHPGFIEGRNDLVQTAQGTFEGTNAFILGIAAGKEPTGRTLPGSTVHNDDVARLHVEALQSKIPSGSYMASWNADDNIDGSKWEDVPGYVAKNFEKEVQSGLLPNRGTMNSQRQRFDSRKTEKVFGWKLQNLEEQVKSVVGHYVELLQKA
jgi:nucleoside-diphosphate-sugar epimerase